MSGVIVEHHVDDPAGRHVTFDGIENPDKLLMPVTLHAAANDFALQHVERGKQGGCAVPPGAAGHHDRSMVLAFWTGYAAAEIKPVWRLMREELLRLRRDFE
jgi:hypothetical protein